MSYKIIPGIYQIRNLVNGKIYIGSSQCIYRRRTHHFKALSKNIHHNIKLQRAFNKYGEENFIFETLELSIVDSKDKMRLRLIKREQHYIDTLNPEYNSSKVAGSCLGMKRSEATKNKMKLRIYSDSIIKNMKIAAKIRSSIYGNPMKGKRHSNASKLKISNSRKGGNAPNAKITYQINIFGDIINIFDTVKLAMIKTNISMQNISACCRGEQHSAGGYIWCYKYNIDNNSLNIPHLLDSYLKSLKHISKSNINSKYIIYE